MTGIAFAGEPHRATVFKFSKPLLDNPRLE